MRFISRPFVGTVWFDGSYYKWTESSFHMKRVTLLKAKYKSNWTNVDTERHHMQRIYPKGQMFIMPSILSSSYPERYELNTSPAVLFPSALVLNGRNSFSVENCKLSR